MNEYISRKVACNLSFSHGLNEDGILYIPYYEAINYLQNISPADVRPVVRGHWIGVYNDLKCSVCGKNWDELRTADGDDWGYWEDKPPYCPNCGAEMTGDADNG